MKWFMYFMLFLKYFVGVVFAYETCYSNTSNMNLSVPNFFVYYKNDLRTFMLILPDRQDRQNMVAYRCPKTTGFSSRNCSCRYVYTKEHILTNCANIHETGFVFFLASKNELNWVYSSNAWETKSFYLSEKNPYVCRAYIGI